MVSRVPDKSYYRRQAANALKLARCVASPGLAAALVEQAAQLTAHVDETGSSRDLGPKADVESMALTGGQRHQSR